MDLKIGFGAPILDKKRAEALTCGGLDNFCCAAPELDRLNLFFALHHYEDAGNGKLAARPGGQAGKTVLYWEK